MYMYFVYVAYLRLLTLEYYMYLTVYTGINCAVLHVYMYMCRVALLTW